MSTVSAAPEGPIGRTRGGARAALLVVHHPVTRRVGQAVLVAFGVMVVSFSIMRLTPGDPAQTILGMQATPEAIAALREQLGLNGSIFEQFGQYIGPMFRGDLGVSLQNGQAVTDIIIQSAPVTLQLIAMAIILAFCIALVLAVPAARHRSGATGLAVRLSTSAALSVPVFFSGQVLILLVAMNWHLLPVGGYDPQFPENLRYLILPAVTACGPLTPILLRVMQSSVADTMEEAFVETAVVRGLRGSRLGWRYLLRPSLTPTIALTAYIIGSLFGAAVVLEMVFNLPGMGSRLLNAVSNRDYPVVQGIVFVMGILVVAVNLAADLISGALDPRARVR